MTRDAEAWSLTDALDLVEVQEQHRPIENHVPPGPDADDAVRRGYFASPKYPYAERMPIRTYYREKYDIQVELVKLQNWVKDVGAKVLILMEGRDAAGKGSTIKRFLEYLNPRGAAVVALDKPTERERSQWYFQRYVQHLPSGGEIVLFDRSWYNRAGVERVMRFCTDEEYENFLHQAPRFEAMLRADGVHLFKFYLSISKQEQAKRFEERRENPLKRWKLSPIDIEAQARWNDYSEAKDRALRDTDTPDAPWTLVKADDKLRARVETMRTVLAALEYTGKDPSVARDPDPWIVAPARLVYGGSDQAASAP